MSQNTVETVTNGTDSDGNVENMLNAATDQQAPATTLSEEELLEFLQLKAKARKAKERADAAAAERKRLNGRPIDPETGKELPASVAFFQVEATWLENWLTTYANDPAKFMQRIRDQFLPMVVSLSQTPSSLMSTEFDSNRRTMRAWMVPANVQPKPQDPKSSK